MSERSSERTKFDLNKLIVTTVLGGIGMFILFFIPPTSIFAVFGFIALICCLIYITVSFFLSRKYQWLFTAFFALFLLVNYLVGFQVLNTVLILSFIIGLALLL